MATPSPAAAAKLAQQQRTAQKKQVVAGAVTVDTDAALAASVFGGSLLYIVSTQLSPELSSNSNSNNIVATYAADSITLDAANDAGSS